MTPNKLRRLIPEDLVKFLKKERVLCRFVNNMTNYLNKIPSDVAKGKIFRLSKSCAIQDAFIWNKTQNQDDTFDFWFKIHVKWVEECNSKSKNYYE